MKRWLALLLVLVLCLALAACGDSKKNDDDDDDDDDDGEGTTTTTTVEAAGDGNDWGDPINPVTPATRTLFPATTTAGFDVAVTDAPMTQATTTATMPQFDVPVTVTTTAPVTSNGADAVAAYVASQKEAAEKAASSEQITAVVSSSGTHVVYSYVLNTVTAPTDEQIAQFQANLEQQNLEASLLSLVQAMKTECAAVDGLEVYYFSADGVLIAALSV